MIGQPASLRAFNKRSIVRALLRNGQASRADLAKQIGLSQVTAGKIVDDLLAERIVEETGPALPQTRLGRPGRLLQLNTTRTPFLAVQLGTDATQLSRVPLGLPRQDRWTASFPTPASGDLWKKQLARSFSAMDNDEIVAVLVSVPGVVDERTGQVLLAPNLHWLENVNLIEVVQGAVGKRVTLLQEQRALAYGQLAVQTPAQEGPADFLIVDFGEGFGAAAVVNGRVYVGPLALNGELGHTPVVGNYRKCGCGAVGCVETLVNRSGMLQSFAAATRKRNPAWSDLAKHIDAEGMPQWLREALDHAATAIAAAANVMGIQRVILTGNVMELPPIVVEHLADSVVNGCLWRRFGPMICHGGERHRLAGLVAAGIDRILMPVESWER